MASERLVGKNIGWTSHDLATSDGAVIYLPSAIGLFATEEENFAWYKIISTHQVGHIEYKTYDFDLDRARAILGDLRTLPAGAVGSGLSHPGKTPSRATGPLAGRATDLSGFFTLFPDARLARDVFTVAEDFRVDSRIMEQYSGLAPVYSAAQAASLLQRPRIDGLPAREALVELLIRVSLRQTEGLQAPRECLDAAREASRLMQALGSPGATVEDSAAVVAGIYGLFSRVDNRKIDAREFSPLKPSTPAQPAAGAIQESPLLHLHEEPDRDYRSVVLSEPQYPPDRSLSYRSPRQVTYRGVFKPELAQLLSLMAARAAAEANQGRGQPISREQIKQLMQDSPEVELGPSDMPDNLRWETLVDNVIREMVERGPSPYGLSGGPSRDDERGEPLEAVEPDTYVYDEWDFADHRYKKRWCLVREKQMGSEVTGFFLETLLNHIGLAQRIRRQFEAIALQIYRKEKRLEDGEEHDLDSVIEAVIDRRAGRPTSDKLFWRRKNRERSVAVAFLLDMSASTGDVVDRKRSASAQNPKRLIDIEKEALVLLTNALEVLKDGYGIYGFSGYGRKNVEFYTIKDLQEQLTPMVMQRIDGIRPLNATRMGPAIRHTNAKLLQYKARYRFLFLISDGRPQDWSYSKVGEPRQYAVQDTRMALLEGRRHGITPFCLTVDKEGHDYLKTMMQDMNYEVLWDIAMLPERLPQLYRKLTT